MLLHFCIPPRVRVRATVKLSAAFFHDESSIPKCNSIKESSTRMKFSACSIEYFIPVQFCSLLELIHFILMLSFWAFFSREVLEWEHWSC